MGSTTRDTLLAAVCFLELIKIFAEPDAEVRCTVTLRGWVAGSADRSRSNKSSSSQNFMQHGFGKLSILVRILIRARLN